MRSTKSMRLVRTIMHDTQKTQYSTAFTKATSGEDAEKRAGLFIVSRVHAVLRAMLPKPAYI